MIDIKELRIGNYIKVDDLPIEQVTLETFKTLSEYPFHLNKFEPTPLTEEWLIKFGFIKELAHARGIAEWNEFYSDKCLNFCIFDKGIDTNDFHFFASDGLTIKVNNVHKLQNLFHSITGKELEISEFAENLN